MSDESKGELQFDRADFAKAAPPGGPCSSCGQGIWSVYYAVNGRVLCEACKAALDLGVQGSGIGRFLRAALYGAGAGAVGSGIWYAVRAATGYEVGIIAVAVGVMVGAAVRKGSNGRGGWRYQTLAMFLTYASIVSAYVPEIVSEIRKMGQAGPKAPAGPEADALPGPATGSAVPEAGSRETATAEAPAAPQEGGPSRSLLGLGMAVFFLFALAFAAPFLGGFENIMGIIIIGIGVYEAWKINKAQALEITGPHRVGSQP
jgi:hypothetical protein